MAFCFSALFLPLSFQASTLCKRSYTTDYIQEIECLLKLWLRQCGFSMLSTLPSYGPGYGSISSSRLGTLVR
ncbi:hypothetical protein M378DRAFT_160389 [Amanita muscaria Koide BX008]|uniref:Secreted protein n=1 Tax=Amanita muscaria (strain Koide BX008) TaxID=946122 RepID=A0A0C2XDE5_AMAMK|nr:hypothetical protein M378DRAFT_160389 [Amanita muscaria Koide BX008]